MALAAHHHREAVRHRSASARALNEKLLQHLREDQIYRIDHYLGKETVQNIMVLRFANGMFEPIWNRDHIDHVQITVAESVGSRSAAAVIYDATGALRDMVPNHLFQLLSLVAMEPPARFAADAVRAEKAEAARRHPDSKPRGSAAQFGARAIRRGLIDNQPVAAYRKTEDVKPDSATETYVAIKLNIDNWRWAGVPFYLRTGKALRAAIDRDRDQVQAGAGRNVPRHAGRPSGPKLPGARTSSRTNASACSSMPRCRGPRSRSAASA